MKAKGNASSTSANSADNNGSGLRVEMDADLTGALGLNAFAATRGQVKIYGDNLTAGIDLASAFLLHADALLFNNSGTPVDASAPVAGKIGKTGDSALGDVALIKLRFYLENAGNVVVGRPEGGIIQWDLVTAFSFTA
jgi:hypothetical protein